MTTQSASIILNSLTHLCAVVQICVSVYILLLILLRRMITREHRIDYLLYANTYTAALFLACLWIDMCAYSIYGQIFVEISFDGWWCKTNGYLLYIGGTTFFHTFALQAIYPLCCILYRTKIRLHSFRLYIILSISLWILTSFELLPSFLIGDIEYIAHGYYCQFAPTGIRGSLTVSSIGYLLPFGVTVFCYMWTMYNIRKQTVVLVTVNQQANIHRDIIILNRVVIFLTILTTVGAPHICLPIIYVIIGYLPLWIVSLESTLTVSAVLAVSIVLLYISPQLT